MYNVVNGKTLRLDQHSAEIIEEGKTIFRFPVFLTDGKIGWKGCYKTPNTALAGLKCYSDKKKLTKEKHDELQDIFSSSLFRTDSENPATKDVHYTVTMAPSHTAINIWGGSMSTEEFRKSFDPGMVMDKIYTQKIPSNETVLGVSVNGSGGTVPAGGEGSPSGKWHAIFIPQEAKCTDEFLSKFIAPFGNCVDVPRNFGNVISSCLELYHSCRDPSIKIQNPNAFCIYVHPELKNTFALGDPNAFDSCEFNKLANKVMGKQAVLGSVVLITKRKTFPTVTNKKKKKTQEVQDVEMKEPELKPVQSVPDCTTTKPKETQVKMIRKVTSAKDIQRKRKSSSDEAQSNKKEKKNNK